MQTLSKKILIVLEKVTSIGPSKHSPVKSLKHFTSLVVMFETSLAVLLEFSG